MINKKFDLEDRFVSLAADIGLFCKDLPKDFTGQYYGNQLLRSSGSAALNFGEALGTTTLNDYRFKAILVMKELKESRVNLKILNKISYGTSSILIRLLDEIERLVKIVSTIIKNKTAQS